MKKINILMAVNREYLKHLCAVICSISRNCKCAIELYLMHSNLKSSDIQYLKKLSNRLCNVNLYEIRMDVDFLKGAKVLNHFTIEMYYRIFASDFLPRSIDRILWLDADTIVLKDLTSFFFMDMQGRSIVCCGHREKSKGDFTSNYNGTIRLGLKKEEIYFNSGVLLMNLKKIRNNFNSSDVLELIYKKSSVLENPDQDILNLLYVNDKLVVDWRLYNFQIHYDWEYEDEKSFLENNTLIIHYVGPCKPWNYTSNHFSYMYYWEYYLLYGKKIEYFKIRILRVAYYIYTKRRLSIKL